MKNHFNKTLFRDKIIELIRQVINEAVVTAASITKNILSVTHPYTPMVCETKMIIVLKKYIQLKYQLWPEFEAATYILLHPIRFSLDNLSKLTTIVLNWWHWNSTGEQRYKFRRLSRERPCRRQLFDRILASSYLLILKMKYFWTLEPRMIDVINCYSPLSCNLVGV